MYIKLKRRDWVTVALPRAVNLFNILIKLLPKLHFIVHCFVLLAEHSSTQLKKLVSIANKIPYHGFSLAHLRVQCADC